MNNTLELSKDLLSQRVGVDTTKAPLFALRGLRDKQVEILRQRMEEWWDYSWDRGIEEAMTDLIEQHDLRCLAALEESAARDRTGSTLEQLHTTKKLCRLVAQRELTELAAARNKPFGITTNRGDRQ